MEQTLIGKKRKKGFQRSRPRLLKVFRESQNFMNMNVRSLDRKPVIIYLRSPEIIHTEPANFMALVQRLTGSSSLDAAEVKEGCSHTLQKSHSDFVTPESKFSAHVLKSKEEEVTKTLSSSSSSCSPKEKFNVEMFCEPFYEIFWPE